MYRRTDPTEPDGVARRPEPPTQDGPAWLTDRPEPRSSYLFGDEPEQPGPYPSDAPTGGWAAGGWHARADRHPAEPPAEPEWTGYAPTPDRTGYTSPVTRGGFDPATEPTAHHPTAEPGHHRTAEPAGYHRTAEPAGYHPTVEPAGYRPDGSRTGDHLAAPFEPAWRADQEPAAGWRPVTDAPPEESGRHRQRRGLPRPLLIGGAAAAATLVVSLGVSALLLPGGGDRTAPTAQDVPATAPAEPEATDAAPTDAASPTAAPTSAQPSPTRAATPKASRTTAASRQLARTPAPRTTAPRAAVAPGISAELREVVDLVNQERAKAGCKALSIDDKLMLAAQRHSQDQADHQTMTHDGSDGSTLGVRLNRVGYAFSQAAENVAWNQQSPAEVMTAWMNSSGHRKNILNCAYTEIGVGVARSNGPYWTQDFGTPR
ncbi:CAP domain-containing protein [Micromonospora sp. NPDC050495]|uniref:CAP domain-containing protein n=1 Tax=Micromonospora sp. NPDC050495 TaxID=3154936 RepID=UPI0033CE9277